jgi:U4/U6.U5 tri-snRNP-associated protein 2
MKRKAEELEHNEIVTDPIDSNYDEEEKGAVPSYEESLEQEVTNGRVKCPYLDTINRQAIDFDSEKLCSVTLTNMNVYVCLVCGKYFQGRGKNTPAYTHSVQAGHFVFMNLQSGRAFCLPDSYEIVDSSLQDVQKCLSPVFSRKELEQLNDNTSLARDVHGVSYLPGFIGLNNLNSTDYLNSLLHALAHVAPFRDFWLQTSLYSMSKSNIAHQFGLVRSLSLLFSIAFKIFTCVFPLCFLLQGVA